MTVALLRGAPRLTPRGICQVSRLHPEQCEAEGMLLRAGAVDASADHGALAEGADAADMKTSACMPTTHQVT